MAYNNSYIGIALDGKLYDARLKDKEELNTPFYNPMYGEELNRENHILMQYTGLKDKNGKEIYEGDIIRGERLHYYNYLKGLQEAIIEWLHCGAWYPFANDDDGMPYPESEECEIIGNIYENPELIGDQK